MITDDEEFCISAMQSMLKSRGVNVNERVDICMNGKEAVDLFIESFQNDIKYKIIFLDFSMPIMNGITAS
jgi:CheY-like chemotaxis protein